MTKVIIIIVLISFVIWVWKTKLSMAKTIKITFYNPKELWVKFCNWAFWPRHIKCVKWCQYYDTALCQEVAKILKTANKSGAISDEAAKLLEMRIKSASSDVAKATAEIKSEYYKYEPI